VVGEELRERDLVLRDRARAIAAELRADAVAEVERTLGVVVRAVRARELAQVIASTAS
jgi:hypothetical protein